MPCIKCPNGKYRFGSGRCVYTSLASCQKAEKGYYAGMKGKGKKKGKGYKK